MSVTIRCALPTGDRVRDHRLPWPEFKGSLTAIAGQPTLELHLAILEGRSRHFLSWTSDNWVAFWTQFPQIVDEAPWPRRDARVALVIDAPEALAVRACHRAGTVTTDSFA